VLILRRLNAPPVLPQAAGLGAILTVLAFTMSAVEAGSIRAGGCTYGTTYGAGAVNCVLRSGPLQDPYVRTVPESHDEAENQRAAERDRRWGDRCRPVIVQDRYGVPRYTYAAPGCEFGVLQ